MHDTSHFLLATCAIKDRDGLKKAALSLDRVGERPPGEQARDDRFHPAIDEYFSQRHEFEKAEALNRVQRFSIGS